MSDDIKKLVARLRATFFEVRDFSLHDVRDAANALEALAAECDLARSSMRSAVAERDRLKDEVERITKERDDLDANGIHTCHDNCTKHFCVMRRRMQAAEAERDRLKAALVRLRDCDWVISLPDRMDAVREIARKALEAEE